MEDKAASPISAPPSRPLSSSANHSASDSVAFQAAIERIKLATPIEGVVQARVPELKRKGKLYWACCPFHEEKTPSFAVDPGRGTWRCFGACSEGGDSIGFVQRFDGLPFWDALTLLANECGEALPARGGGARRPEEDEQREQLFDLLARAQALYARNLAGEDGRGARDYLAQRGLGPGVVQSFGCGWAPARGNPLLTLATRKGFKLQLLLDAGLVKQAEDGRPFDFFRKRLLIPIRDRLGRTVGFGGRILPSDEARGPKYVNTPDTRLFHKGRLIFGLDRAADTVRKRRHLVLVEGYTDVMAAHQAGVEHVAAVLGTATTSDHATLVRRSAAERVTLVFDGDAAGGRASEKALGELLPLGLHLDVISLPAGQDPCDLLVKQAQTGQEGPSAQTGGAAFEALLEDARDWFDWSLDGLTGLSGADLASGVEATFALIARLERPVEEALRRKQLAQHLSIPEHAVEAQWKRWRGARRSGSSRSGSNASSGTRGHGPGGMDGAADRVESTPVDPREKEVFRSLVGSLLLDNSLIPLYADLIERCPAGPEQRIFAAVLHLFEHGDETEPIDAGSVTSALGVDPARDEVVTLELIASRADSPQALARDQELWLERRDNERELSSLRQLLVQTAQGQLGTPSGSNPSDSPEQSQEDLLRSLHMELKKRRVPSAMPSRDHPERDRPVGDRPAQDHLIPVHPIPVHPIPVHPIPVHPIQDPGPSSDDSFEVSAEEIWP